MKLILSLTAVLVFSLTAVWPVLESGDQVRGGKGEGQVCQYQVDYSGVPVFDGDGCVLAK